MGDGFINSFTKSSNLFFKSHIFLVSLLSDNAHPFGGTKGMCVNSVWRSGSRNAHCFRTLRPLGEILWDMYSWRKNLSHHCWLAVEIRSSNILKWVHKSGIGILEPMMGHLVLKKLTEIEYKTLLR